MKDREIDFEGSDGSYITFGECWYGGYWVYTEDGCSLGFANFSKPELLEVLRKAIEWLEGQGDESD